jgi:hypothetical protein
VPPSVLDRSVRSNSAASYAGDMTDPRGTCDSCGAEAADLVEVHRVYLTPAAWDRDERVEVVEEVERWCWPCRTHYPHQELHAG